MFKIVDATPADATTIRDIAEKTWWPTYSSMLEPGQIRFMLDTYYSKEALTQVIEENSQHFILLTNETGVQGFASYGAQADVPDAFKLYKLYVLPENQGKRYGISLIEEVKLRLQEIGIHSLDLNVARSNTRAKRFYDQVGFRVIGEKDIPFGPYLLKDFIMRIDF